MKTQNTQRKPAGSRITSTSAGFVIRLNTYQAAVLALFFAGATLLSTSAASAATITVINTNDSGPGSLRQALVDANDGDTIDFDPSLNGQRITLTSGQLNVDKDVTISGPGAKNLAVDGNARSRVFYVNPGKTVTIDGLTVANGYNDQGGGGIRNEDATVTVSNCTISGNSATTPGGGISNEGGGIATLTITNSTISGNSAADGGGIYNAASGAGGGATLTVTNSTISGNSAYEGGGIFNDAYEGHATVTITNSTLSGNSATNNGGGIYSVAGSAFSSGDSIVTVSNSTISDNSAPSVGGGIYNAAYNASIAGVETGNTIFDAGSSGENIFNSAGTVTSLGYNVSSDDGGGFLTGAGDQINTDPLLGPLQNNGGPTFTHALLPGSPAIDAGDPNFTPPPFYDQRGPGYLRVVNGRIDKGAFEVQAPMAQSAFSRKVHGGAGTFDIPLPLTGNVGVECRSGGAANDYQMIISFANSVTVGSAAVTSGTGSVSSFSVSGSQVTVNLTGVTNVQRITVTLFDVNDGTHMGDVPVSMGVLVGDVNGNAVVNASDVSLTKSQVGQAVSGSNFREDVNANGSINSVDVALVKSDVGTALPP
jgi:hypothetical protein